MQNDDESLVSITVGDLQRHRDRQLGVIDARVAALREELNGLLVGRNALMACFDNMVAVFSEAHPGKQSPEKAKMSKKSCQPRPDTHAAHVLMAVYDRGPTTRKDLVVRCEAAYRYKPSVVDAALHWLCHQSLVARVTKRNQLAVYRVTYTGKTAAKQLVKAEARAKQVQAGDAADAAAK